MESTASQNTVALFARNSDIFISVSIIGILIIMILPLPTWLLDILLSCNITIGRVIQADDRGMVPRDYVVKHDYFA